MAALREVFLLLLIALITSSSPDFEGLNAVLTTLPESHCSVFIVTDGSSEEKATNKLIKEVPAPWGVGVFEARVRGNDSNITRLVGELKRLRKVSWCVSVVVVSDDPAFLTSFAEKSLGARLLVWATRLLVVTRLSLQELSHVSAFSMTNAVILVSNEGRRMSAFIALPYSPSDSPMLEVAKWTPGNGLVMLTELSIFPKKFTRFYGGASLVVAAEEFIPHVKVVEEQVEDHVEATKTNVVRQGEGGIRFSFEGPMANILDILATSMNFSYTYVRPRDGSWGNEKADGSWSGMVGMVYRKEVDIGLGPFAMTTKRAEVVDYTMPILIDYGRILGGMGRPEIDPWGFLFPLTQEVWIGVIVMVAVVLIMVFVFSSVSGNEAPGQGSRNLYFGVLRVLLQQDVVVLSNLWWERVLMSSWIVVTLVLVKSYAGNLMSLLAVRHIPQPYQTLNDVLDDTSSTMIWEANTMFTEFLSNVKSGIFHEVWQAGEKGRIVYRKSTEYLDTVDALVRRKPYVLIVEDLTQRVLMGQDFSATGRCDFYRSQKSFLPFMFSMIGEKGSPIVDAMSKRIWSVTESGLYEHWINQFIPNSTSCANVPSKITVNTSLGISNLWGLFAVLLAGESLALVFLGVEVVIDRFTSDF